jgi:hypothetical protein
MSWHGMTIGRGHLTLAHSPAWGGLSTFCLKSYWKLDPDFHQDKEWLWIPDQVGDDKRMAYTFTL